MMVKVRILVCLLVAGLMASFGASLSQAVGTSDAVVHDTPVYFEKTDRFYELVTLKHSYPGRFGRNATGWRQVVRMAEKRFHQGRRGRLAVVDSPELNIFLRNTFKADRGDRKSVV